MKSGFHPSWGLAFLSLFCVLAGYGRPVGAQPTSTEVLTPQNRLAIVRALAYEYATALQPLPASQKEKQAVAVDSKGQIDEEELRQLLANHGAAVHPGEIIQITAIEFKRDYILLEINGGGGKRGKKWWQRIQIQGGMGGSLPSPQSPGPPRPPGPGSIRSGTGTWIKLSFPHLVPDMTPDEVKQMLAGVLDFSEPSPTQQWIDTIPEEFRQAIEEHRAMPGMNRKMVLAALGRPNHKVRETKNGVEHEDWIYGYPPLATFVTFVGGQVIEVQEFK
ncbi:MAG: hypothetical protein V3R29_05215 [Candidatus Acidoferrales bacterium]